MGGKSLLLISIVGLATAICGGGEGPLTGQPALLPAPTMQQPQSVERSASPQSSSVAPAQEPLPLPSPSTQGWEPSSADPYPVPPEMQGVDLSKQTSADAFAKSVGCIQCHQGIRDMHDKETVRLGCCDCHGGNPCAITKEEAHVFPRFPAAWPSSANPVRSYTLLNHESAEFIRFVNPGDLRVAHISCGACHAKEVLEVRKSMMTHGCMLWGAALYNNGAVPFKAARFGESYSMCGAPQRLQTVPPPTPEETANKGVLPYLDPLLRYEVSQPANVLRIFERGGRFRPEVGIPEKDEDPGKPRTRLSDRGLGTENRTDPVFVGLQKTRLFDPTLNFLGTNDHPGDYRSSGCSGCHVIYANDRSPVNSGPYAKFGHLGTSFSPDPTIPKDEPGHPIDHRFALGIPSSQCIVCHIHPGTNVLNEYLGFMWWDNETDGNLMYPAEQRKKTEEEIVQDQMANPDDTSIRGLWSDPKFLENLTDLNSATRHTQFADFHGHGWVFRAVFKKDRSGNLLDYLGRPIPDPNNILLQAAMTPPTLEEKVHGKERDGIPVHLMDIHLEKGMHCIDCHFNQDNHGNTKLYGEVRAAIEIQCTDCHGTASERPKLTTTGPAAPINGFNLRQYRTPWGKGRFEIRGDSTIIQHSMVDENQEWEIVQTVDTVTPGSPYYNVRSQMAKTVRVVDEPNGESKLEWGTPQPGQHCAHENENMSCIACHSAWNPSCFGCHLPQRANKKMPQLHNDGDVTRNYTSYNFQTLRDDVFMLARDGRVTGNRIGPARSSCAIHVSSYNGNREQIYVQQQTISGDGMSGIAFSTNVPHTVRGGPPLDLSTPQMLAQHSELYGMTVAARGGTTETKTCTDCHLSKQNDNNAIMAQLLMQGTNFVNFIGRYCWVACGEEGLEGVEVTELDEPQAVIGSTLHELAYPEEFKKFVEGGRLLKNAEEHPGKDISQQILHPLSKPEILQVQNRGEFLYAACGEYGMRVFDIAFIDDKAFSERVTTAPVSPIGQKFYVPSRYCTAVAAPTTIAPDPTRIQHPENFEQPINDIYAHLYMLDRYEGLILVGAGTLLDGNPLNNFLSRELTWNPGGILNGGRAITIVGHYAYICCDAGLVVVSLDDPLHPVITSVIGDEVLHCPKAVQMQFRYAFVCDCDGVKVLDVTNLAKPVPVSRLNLPEANNIYLARTYAYVAGGESGLIILDITNPEIPKVDQVFDAGGCINDLHDVKLGITNASEFAYLADGKNGMHIVQLTSPDIPGSAGYSPRPMPMLIATRHIPKGGEALAIAKGIDRDRAVDESGSQIAVFGRVGARPLNFDEQQRMYLHNGRVWRVSDDPFDRDLYRWLLPAGKPSLMQPLPENQELPAPQLNQPPLPPPDLGSVQRPLSLRNPFDARR
ncbi:MAG TPA: hypothetical protein VGI75_01185 [Pirellulales bacterium]